MLKRLVFLLLCATGAGAQTIPFRITSVACPTIIIGKPYHCQLGAYGGKKPYHWSVDTGSLPPGLTLSDSGLISGTVPVGVAPVNIKVIVAQKEFLFQIRNRKKRRKS